MSTPDFAARYGAWAVVAGASEGLGRAFSVALAARGLNVLLVARREEPLRALAEQLARDHGISAETLALDLSVPDATERLAAVTADREVGLVVANAASVPIGPFATVPPDSLDLAIAVNCRTTLHLARQYLPIMAGRGRGGMVIMSSLAGMQGTPMLSTYASTKAFGLVLAEGLWHEFAPSGVHVIGCAAGAISDPNLAAVKAKRAPGTLPPERIAEDTLAALGLGPRVVPGGTNRVAALLMGRLLPRRMAVRIMARNTADLRHG